MFPEVRGQNCPWLRTTGLGNGVTKLIRLSCCHWKISQFRGGPPWAMGHAHIVRLTTGLDPWGGRSKDGDEWWGWQYLHHGGFAGYRDKQYFSCEHRSVFWIWVLVSWCPQGPEALFFITTANDPRSCYMWTSSVCFSYVRSGSFLFLFSWSVSGILTLLSKLMLAPVPPRLIQSELPGWGLGTDFFLSFLGEPYVPVEK